MISCNPSNFQISPTLGICERMKKELKCERKKKAFFKKIRRRLSDDVSLK
jgi:hypothetical protein